MATSEERIINETLFEMLSTPGMEKRAIDSVNDFTRLKLREEGFWRRIMTPLPISNDEFDRQVDTDKPVKVVDMEIDSPAAITMPFANLPINFYIWGRRYRITFERYETPRFTKDINELRTYVMDIRQILASNAIKDLLAAEDGSFITAVNAAVGPARDVKSPFTDEVQWRSFAGGISRENIAASLAILEGTKYHLPTTCALMNNVTIRSFQAWQRNEMGGDYAEELIQNGIKSFDLLGITWYVTIKRDLVPDDTIYYFTMPKFIGKFYLLEDATMAIKREVYFLEFFAYESLGGAIGHAGSVARADYL
ncbi:MAG: hypothetical protein QXH92_04175 [Candidatus Aenigmatarchaeota archaeon]